MKESLLKHNIEAAKVILHNDEWAYTTENITYYLLDTIQTEFGLWETKHKMKIYKPLQNNHYHK